ncbi:7581_t:CDS:2 [Diversispora eburnea]|uniref:7581_t:CDS:1 n=1 Tax=Diversispora eburnea TaxID=1213867 RepID=A0A9N9EXT6_9GLOM|nr:7581_t:CDS:2 [Diversispora eburnea]
MRGLFMLSTKELSSQTDTNNKLDSPSTPITPTTPSTPNTTSKMFRFFFWNSPKIEKYSVENINELLLDYSKRGNDAGLIESLRELTQVLVWGMR